MFMIIMKTKIQVYMYGDDIVDNIDNHEALMTTWRVAKPLKHSARKG